MTQAEREVILIIQEFSRDSLNIQHIAKCVDETSYFGRWIKCTKIYNKPNTRSQSEVINTIRKLIDKGFIKSMMFDSTTAKFFELKPHLEELRQQGFIRIRKRELYATIDVSPSIHEVKICQECPRRLECIIK